MGYGYINFYHLCCSSFYSCSSWLFFFSLFVFFKFFRVNSCILFFFSFLFKPHFFNYIKVFESIACSFLFSSFFCSAFTYTQGSFVNRNFNSKELIMFGTFLVYYLIFRDIICISLCIFKKLAFIIFIKLI